MNEHGCVSIKLYLWTLNFEYYTAFTSHEIFFDSFQPFKNGKAIFTLQTIQKQVVGQMWPIGHGLLTLTLK